MHTRWDGNYLQQHWFYTHIQWTHLMLMHLRRQAALCGQQSIHICSYNEGLPALLISVDMLYSKHMYSTEAHVQRKECQLTLSTCMAFISSTRPSKEVLRISGGVCAGKVSLKCADEYSLQAANVVYVLAE